MTNDEKIIKILDAIQTQLKEHGAILGALQHASEVYKAGIDNFTHQVSAASGV